MLIIDVARVLVVAQDPSKVKLVSSDIEVILANAKFNPIVCYSRPPVRQCCMCSTLMMITHDTIAQINLLDAEVKRRMAAGTGASAGSAITPFTNCCLRCLLHR
jgi:hypothetical protein